MAASDWGHIREIFEQALRLPVGERARFLDAACADQPELRAEVDAMLSADERAQQDQTSLGAAAPELLQLIGQQAEQQEHDALIGLRLGAWRLLREIGRGGMGAVYLAERDDGAYQQKAAIKLIRPGWDVGELLQRFRAERQILATLNHPHIARLLDGGISTEGKPYLVLEYIEGTEISQHCDAHQLGVDDRLRLFLLVCAAVSHAHQRLIVHRDLKPSNIMVDDSGQVKLLDFGIAKLLTPDANIAVSASRVFTPEYAAPEQVRGEAVTTGVDVYALGLLLYQLLTGQRPYGSADSTPAAYEQAILTQEPLRPSRATTGALNETIERAAARALQPLQLSARLRGDLDAIVLKALRKEPEQRYASVADFAADVQRHLQFHPVAARRGDLRYRATRFLQRHALAAGLGLVALLSLLAGTGIALQQAGQARAEAAKARAALDFMVGLFKLADPVESQGERISARSLLNTGSQRIRAELRGQPEARAELLLAMGEAYRGLGLYKEALPLLAEAGAEATEPRRARLSHAGVQHELGHDTEALSELQVLRSEQSSVGQRDGDFIAQIDLQLAISHQSLNQLDQAEAAYLAALDAQRGRYGVGHRQTQEIMLRYASWLVLTDREEDAHPLTAAVVDSLRGQLPRDDEFFARALSAHAMVVANTGPYRASEALRREELDLNTRIYGSEHPHTLSTRSNLATILVAQQRYAEALPLFEEVLAARRRLLDPEHPQIALGANHLASTLVQLDRAAEARPYADEALRLRLKALGENHRSTAGAIRTLASIEFAEQNLAEAERLFERAIRSYEAALGPNSFTLVASLNDLARVRLALGNAQTACAAAERAFEVSGAAEAAQVTEAQYQFALVGACNAARGSAEGIGQMRDALARLRSGLGEADRRSRIISELLQQAELRTP